MKAHILALLMAMLLLSALGAEDRTKAAADNDDDDDDDDDDITTLTFLIQYEPEPDNDHIDIGLTVQARGSSLKTAIQKVTQIVDQIETVSENFCKENPEEGANCDQVVQVEDFQISAEYVTKRKQQIFQEFVVTHDVTVRVDNTDKIGELADKLLKTENTKIESFDWDSDEEDDDEEEAIEAGKDKAEDMCFHLGMKLHRIVAVEAVQEEDDNSGGDQEEAEDEDEEEGPLVYRFEVQCIADAETAARKQAEQTEEDRLEALEEEKEKKKEQEEEQIREKEKQKKKEKEKEKEKPKAEKEPAADKKKKK